MVKVQGRGLMNSRIVVTGGAGFIGSHTCKLLARLGYEPITYDNLSTGHRDAVRYGPFEQGDILDQDRLNAVLNHWRPEAVIHFAASAYVGESVASPDKYYRNNVVGLLSLLDAMRRAGLDKVVFSSSCAVYGVPDKLPISETSSTRPLSPYGETKLIGERILRDYGAAYGMRHVALRYFNAAGADSDGELGERHDPETHLIPRALMAATGLIDHLEVFGDDYDTPDGTCIRDYVHVDDLADGHVRALRYLADGNASLQVNLGTGTGTSIKEVFAAIERVTNRKVPVKFVARRPGDPAALYADAVLVRKVLDFTASRSDIDNIIRTAVRSLEFPASAQPRS
jgi:UDP-arabinose 4-epimerase